MTLILAGAAVAVQAPANAAPGPGVIHTIRSAGGQSARTRFPYPQIDVCLDADTNTIGRNGTVVQLWKCNDTGQQDWYYEPVNSTDAVIKNSRAGSGFCLDADANTIGRNGTKIQLWGCNGSTQQLWRGFGTNTITNVRAGNGFCLDADTNTINNDGTKVQLWGCNSAVQQQWYLSLPYNKTCKNFGITDNGTWEFTSTGGQGIHVDLINASLGVVNLSASHTHGNQIYSGVLGINGTDTFDASEFGTEPVTYDLTFVALGTNIATVNVTVRSYIC